MKKTATFWRGIFLVILLGGLFQIAKATSYTWSGVTGNWATTTNWAPNGNPGAADDVTFPAGTYTVTLTIAAQQVDSIIVNGNVTITIATSLTVNGNIQSNNSLTFSPAGKQVSFGGTNVPAKVWGSGTISSTGITFVFNKNSGSNVQLMDVQLALTSLGSSQFKNAGAATGAWYDIDNTFTTNNVQIIFSNNGNVNFNGTLGATPYLSTGTGLLSVGVASSASATLGATLGASTIGSVTIGGTGTLNINQTGVVNTLTVSSGNWTNNGGTFNCGTGSTVIFSKIGTQSFAGTTTTSTFYNLTINSASTTLDASPLSTGLFIKGSFKNNGSFTTCTDVTCNGTAAQAVGGTAASTTFNNFTITNTGGPITLGNAITVNGNLTLNSSTTLDDGGYQITGNATGLLSMANGSNLKIGGATATLFPTNFTTANISFTAGSTVWYQATGNTIQFISNTPSQYEFLTIQGTNINSVKELQAATLVNGNLTILSGELWDYGYQISNSGTGTISMAATSYLSLGRGAAVTTFPTTFGTISFNSAATVIFNADVNENITPLALYPNLWLSNAAGTPTKTIQIATTVQGNLQVDATNTLADAGYVVTVNGGATMNGTHTGAGKILLSGGAGAHALSGAGTFQNLEMNDANGATMGSNITVNGLLTFTAGVITATPNTLQMTSSSSVSIAPPPSSSFVSGPVAKTGATDFTFPVGKGTEYRPIQLLSLSGSETFTTEYINLTPNSAGYTTTSYQPNIDHVSNCEYWTLARAGTQTVSQVMLSWDTYSCGVTDLSKLTVANWDGVTWQDLQQFATTGTLSQGNIYSVLPPYQYIALTLSSVDPNFNPLPINLISFTAKAVQNDVVLQWVTSSEVNNKSFTIERKVMGSTVTSDQNALVFSEIGSVAGAGTTTEMHTYQFVDKNAVRSNQWWNYYRLMQTDFDGTSTYSKTVAVQIKPGSAIYPTKSTGIFLYTGDLQGADVSVYSTLGQKVYHISVSAETNSFDLSALPAGVYFISVQSGDNVTESRVIKTNE